METQTLTFELDPLLVIGGFVLIIGITLGILIEGARIERSYHKRQRWVKENQETKG